MTKIAAAAVRADGGFTGRLYARVAAPRYWSLDELLAPVDVIRRAGQRRVRHQVHGERRDVAGTHDAADRERAAELLAPRVDLAAQQPGGQRRVDEAGGDQVHAHRRDLERQAGR